MRCQAQTEARPIIFTLECPPFISFLVFVVRFSRILTKWPFSFKMTFECMFRTYFLVASCATRKATFRSIDFGHSTRQSISPSVRQSHIWFEEFYMFFFRNVKTAETSDLGVFMYPLPLIHLYSFVHSFIYPFIHSFISVLPFSVSSRILREVWQRSLQSEPNPTQIT